MLPYGILMSQVSSRWRAVALGTPQLWTRIHIDVRRHGSSQMVSHYLRRSGALPLDLSIHHSVQQASIAETAYIFHAIGLHIDRWRNLQITCSLRIFLRQFIQSIPLSPAPLLQTLQISLGEGNIYDKDDTLYNIFKRGAPSLKSVRLRGVGLQCLQSLNSVTSLHLHDTGSMRITSPLFSAILHGLPALTHLVLSGNIILDRALNVKVDLPALLSLCVRPPDWSSDHFAYLLNMISAPVLETLLLEQTTVGEIKELARLAFGAPNFPSLRSLTLLPSGKFTLPTWQTLSHMFPAVTHISLADPTTREFLDALSGKEVKMSLSAPLWPYLHTLTLIRRIGVCLDFDQTALYTATSSRIASNMPISRLQFPKLMIDHFKPDDLHRLQQLVDVEEVTVYPGIDYQTYIAHWPHDHE